MFQIDSEIVRTVYKTEPNYIIDYDESCKENVCVIYFSSNGIYFPNTEEVFRKRIVEKNIFEWYHTRIKARKHIFVRDVFKQWYIEGINATINTPEKMEEWLRNETEGCQVITVGSSAGGYAAVLYGSLLNATRVFAFDAQFSLVPLAEKATEEHDPLLLKYYHTERARYFQLKTMLQPSVKYYYFLSVRSPFDIEQYNLLYAPPVPHEQLCCIRFDTSCHGIPVVKDALRKVLGMNDEQLSSFAVRNNHPFIFSLRVLGVRKMVACLIGKFVKRIKRMKKKNEVDNF